MEMSSRCYLIIVNLTIFKKFINALYMNGELRYMYQLNKNVCESVLNVYDR